MRHNDGHPTNSARLAERARQIVMSGEMVADADDRKWSPSRRLILEDDNTGPSERHANGSGGGPMIVIAKNRKHPERRPQTRKRRGEACRTLRGTIRIMPGHEITRDEDQVGADGIHLIDDA